MSQIKLKLVLCGGHGGKTIKLNGRQFVSGFLTLMGDVSQVMPAAEALKRSYQAFVVGSDDHKQWIGQYGNSENDGDGEFAGGQGVHDSSLQFGQQGLAAETPDDGSGTIADPEGTAESGADGNGLRADGPENDGVDKLVLSAIQTLSMTDDEQWTKDGLPKVDVVARISKVQNVTREMINRLAPDFKRA